MMKETEKKMDNVQHVAHQLEARFNLSDVKKKRKEEKGRSDKENRSKLKRKKNLFKETIRIHVS